VEQPSRSGAHVKFSLADLSRKSCLGGPAAIEKEEAEWQHASAEARRMAGEESTRLPFSKSCAGKCMCPHRPSRFHLSAVLFGPMTRPVH
jgi:heterodisulfide reductase subunit B